MNTLIGCQAVGWMREIRAGNEFSQNKSGNQRNHNPARGGSNGDALSAHNYVKVGFQACGHEEQQQPNPGDGRKQIALVLVVRKDCQLQRRKPCPSTEGPSSTPARIFPSTAGCFHRRASSPSRWAVPRRKTSCKSRFSNIAGGSPFKGVMVISFIPCFGHVLA